MSKSLIDGLVDDLVRRIDSTQDGAPRHVLLWLDPELQFSRLISHLEPGLISRNVQFLHFAPDEGMGQLGLKLALLEMDITSTGRVIVYLPGFTTAALEPPDDGTAPELWSVYEYRYKGTVWGLEDDWQLGALPEPPTLLAWLRSRGLRVASLQVAQNMAAGGADSLLARLAERLANQPMCVWPQPLRRTDALNVLGGDPRDSVRELLAAPSNAVRLWGDNRKTVFDRLDDEFGFGLADDDIDPDEFANLVTVTLALCEAWEALGEPEAFPFASRLPGNLEQRRRQARLLRDDILFHTELRPRYRDRILRLEPDYPLISWVTDATSLPAGLPILARECWRAFLDRFTDASRAGWRDAVELLQESGETIEAGQGNPWDGDDGESHWYLISQLNELAKRATEANMQADQIHRTQDLVNRFITGWWRIDDVYLRLRASCGQLAGVEAIRRVADLAYIDYLSCTNQRLTDLIEVTPEWPPDGYQPVTTLQDELWVNEKGVRKAVIICDSLRWDLAERLRELVSGDSSLAAVVSVLPSITPIGMTALLPVADNAVTITWAGSGPPLLQIANGPNLAIRSNRIDFLQQATGEGVTEIAFLALDDLLETGEIPSATMVVTFDSTIDEQGHIGTSELAGLVGHYVGKLARAADLLHQAGIEEVHVVTDHGFILAPADEIDNLGRPELLPVQAIQKKERYAILKPDIRTDDLIQLAPTLDPHSAVLGFPRGIRTLVKAGDYLHGGLSLQECVIPHLISRTRVIKQAKIEVDVRVVSTLLTTGTIPVEVVPKLAAGQQQLGSVRPITVRIWAETTGDRVITVTDPLEEEIRSLSDEVRRALFLKEGLGLASQQELILRAIDVETGRDIARVALTLLVDWD